MQMKHSIAGDEIYYKAFEQRSLRLTGKIMIFMAFILEGAVRYFSFRNAISS